MDLHHFRPTNGNGTLLTERVKLLPDIEEIHTKDIQKQKKHWISKRINQNKTSILHSLQAFLEKC